MPKSILIFGAGLNQLTLIQAAKKLGHTSVVLDPAADPPGKQYADYCYQVAGGDYESTKAIAIKHEVAGIVTAQMENPLKIMAKLAQDLDLIFHSPEVIERATNKHLMKLAFQEYGIPCANGFLIKNSKVLSEAEFDELNLPVIIKPLQAFSSRGVFRIGCYRDYLERVQNTINFSINGDYLIEDFIEGPEYSIESLTYQGVTTVVQHTKKIISSYPTTVELGHIQPSGLGDDQLNAINELVPRVLRALGIDNSASHTELKNTQNGPVIIEVGPRLGGDFISSYLTKVSTGVDMDAASIQIALGRTPNMVQTQNCGSAILYLVLAPGHRVKNIDYPSYGLIHDPDLLLKHLLVHEGGVIPPLTDSSQRSGWVITQGKTGEEAYQYARSVLEQIGKTIVLEKTC